MKNLFVLLILFCVPPLEAVTRYVSKTGNDSNSCATSTSPGTSAKLTIMGASGGVNCMAQGDTLIIQAGTYSEHINTSAKTIPGGTSFANAPTIKAETTGTVTVLSIQTFTGSVNDRYIIFEGLKMNSGGGIYVSGGSHHIRYVNVEVVNSNDHCLQFFGGSTAGNLGGNEFIGGSLHHCGSVGAQAEHGIYIDTPNNVIDGADIYDNCVNGVQILNSYGNPTNGNVLRNNKIHDNHSTSCVGGGQQTGFGSSSIFLSNGSSILVYNNLIYDDEIGIRVASPFRPASSTGVYNNTIYRCDGDGILVDTMSSGAIVRNNILWANSPDTVHDLGSGTIQSNNLTGVDPLFTNSQALDFTLQPSSQAISGGTDLSAIFTTDITGATRSVPWGRGAYKFVSGSPSITLITPNGGESWAVGSIQSIAYTFSNLSGSIVDIEFDPGNDGVYEVMVADDTTATGTFSWTVPNNPTTTGKLRVKDSGAATNDVSDNVFSVTASAGGQFTKRISDNTTGPKIGDISGTEDTQLYSLATSTNYGNAGSFYVVKASASDHTHALLKFTGVPQIQSTAQVDSVTVGIYLQDCTTATAQTLELRRVLRPWGETQATWTNYSTGNAWTTPGGLSAGNDRVGTSLGQITGITCTQGYYTVTQTSGDLVDYFQGVIDGSMQDQGLHLEDTTESDVPTRGFTSSEGTNGQRPYVEITYTLASGSITLTQPVAGTLWAPGQTMPVRWQSSDISGDLRIELLRANVSPPEPGLAYETIIFSHPFNESDAVWSVRAPACDLCIVRATSINDPSVTSTIGPIRIGGSLAAFTAQ